MLQLAAAVWQVSLPAAVQRLATMGFEFGEAPPTMEAVQAHEAAYIQRPLLLERFWGEARKQFIQGNAEVGHLLQTLGLRCPLVGAQLANGPGMLLGAAKRKDVEAAFLPNSFGDNDQVGSDHRVLRGHGWKDCLVIPYNDLPGRLRACLFIGRKGTPEDFAFKSLYLDRAGGTPGRFVEAGLAFHPQLLAGDLDWDNTIIALEDPVLMVRQQQKHFGLFSRPLPLVSWRDDGRYVTQQAWNMFHGRKIILWSAKLSVSLLKQVMRVDGWLVIGRDEKYWGERNAHDSVKRVIKVAKPWRDALADWLDDAKDAEIEDLFHAARLQGVPTNRLVERCRPALQTRIAALLKQDLVQNSLTLGGVTVLEQGDGWFASVRGESSLIADACLRIERVVHRAGRDETYYQGHVFYKNEYVPYCDHRATIEKGGFGWMRTMLIRKEKGLLHFDPKWNARMVSIAVQLHPPEFISGADSVGWDEKRNGFTLPGYTLLPNVVEPNPEGFFGDDAPARCLRPPEALSPAEAQILTEDEQAERTGWGVAGCLLANILAPAFGQQPTGTALVGRGAELIGRALAGPLGCRRLSLDNSRKTEERSLAAEAEHRWPSYVDIPLTTLPATVARWLEGGGSVRSAMAPLDWLHAVPAQFMGTWRLLRDDASTGLPGAYTLAMHKVIPAYLAYLLDNRLEIGLEGGWLPGVFESLATWLESLGGRPETVRGGLENVLDVTDHGTADSFGDLLCRLYTDGKLAYVQQGYLADKSKPTLIGDAKGLSVPKTVLELLPAKGRIEIDPLKITAALAGAELLLGETDEAWGVPLTWWSRRLHSWRSVRARLLRVKT